jgi:voltage-gated potassium channel
MFIGLKKKWTDFMNNEELKNKIYMIIYDTDTPLGKLFDVCLICFILLSVTIVILESVFPPSFKPYLHILEWVFTLFFTLEYLLRLYSAPSPAKYAFSFFGIVDFLATLPTYLSFFFTGAHSLLAIRILRLVRVFRVFKLFSYWREGEILLQALRDGYKKIIVFFVFIATLVVCLGTLMYVVEGGEDSSNFPDIPTSIYWAVVTTTTVGYGDIAPVTGVGRFLSAIVMLIGYTVLAVPIGIFSASMISEHKKQKAIPCPHCHRPGNEHDSIYCKYCGNRLQDEEREVWETEDPIITSDGEIK